MTENTANLTFGVGLVVGLLVSGVVIAHGDSMGTDAPIVRPNNVAEQATWQVNIFGAPGWLHCRNVEANAACTAYSRSGVELVRASYVPVSGNISAEPPTDIVAREVERVWINKVAMVPDGAVEFPAAGKRLVYADGLRVGLPF